MAMRAPELAGAMFWILTPDPRRGYGVTYATPRDKERAAQRLRARRRCLRHCSQPIHRRICWRRRVI